MPRLWIFVALLLPSVCRAQVTGTFSLDKATFARGEPVFLRLMLHNDGDEPEEIWTADPYSFCSGYEIHITREGSPNPACSLGYGGSCPSGAIMLPPHGSRTERILLNYQNDSRGDLVVLTKFLLRAIDSHYECIEVLIDKLHVGALFSGSDVDDDLPRDSIHPIGN